MPFQYIKPLDPALIPEGCHAVWDAQAEEWTFPKWDLPAFEPAPPPLTPEEIAAMQTESTPTTP